MAITWPQADYPRAGGGAADLFGAEPVVDAEFFVAPPDASVAREATVDIAIASFTLAGAVTGSSNPADVSWVGSVVYSPPSGNFCNVTWYAGAATPEAIAASASATVAHLSIAGSAMGGHYSDAAASAAVTVASLSIAGSASAVLGASGAAGAEVVTLSFGATAAGRHYAASIAAVEGFFSNLLLSGGVVGQLCAQGQATGAIPFATTLTGTATAQHPRYEVRGQVRLAGVAVERRVRAYGRDVGELLGQGDTVGGFFNVHTGFAAIECTVLPIDLSADATDYEPPAANRVWSVPVESAA